MKPYLKLSYALVVIGMAIFAFERFGLAEIAGPGRTLHLNGTLLSVLVVAPVVLIAAGCLVFMFGKMRRL